MIRRAASRAADAKAAREKYQEQKKTSQGQKLSKDSTISLPSGPNRNNSAGNFDFIASDFQRDSRKVFLPFETDSETERDIMGRKGESSKKKINKKKDIKSFTKKRKKDKSTLRKKKGKIKNEDTHMRCASPVDSQPLSLQRSKSDCSIQSFSSKLDILRTQSRLDDFSQDWPYTKLSPAFVCVSSRVSRRHRDVVSSAYRRRYADDTPKFLKILIKSRI